MGRWPEIDATGYAELGDYLDEHHVAAGEEGAAAWLHERMRRTPVTLGIPTVPSPNG